MYYKICYMKISVNAVLATNDQVFLEVLQEEEKVEGLNLGKNLATKLDPEFYRAKILSVGPLVPELYTVNSICLFNTFAGKTPPTKDSYTKIVPYNNLVAFLKEDEMKVENVIPTQDRVTILLDRSNEYDENGIHLAGSDPREGEVLAGTIVHYGPDVNKDLIAKVPVGTKVFFDPYVGNPINDEIRVIFAHDILFAEVLN